MGYLLFEDGNPRSVVHGQTVTVKLASERHYVFTVRALDSAGYLSAPAPELRRLHHAHAALRAGGSARQ